MRIMPVEVLVSAQMADELGLQAGETYMTFRADSGASGRSVQFPIYISGIWEATDPDQRLLVLPAGRL